MRGSRYSTGSSTVMILHCGLLSSVSAAYRVVVLPLPVGPVTSTRPCGLWITWRRRGSSSSGRPSSARLRVALLWSSRRMTAASPFWVGMVASRTSRLLSRTRTVKRPSWGRRFSEMSAPPISLRREISAGAMRLSSITVSCSTPSMRRRMRSTFSSGSMWMSEALALAASSNTVWIRRTTGASLALESEPRAPRSKADSPRSWPTSLARLLSCAPCW